MTTPEKPRPIVPSENKPIEFKLILPSLTVPYEGVFEEVYTEYLSDPERFKVALGYRLQTDNPSLQVFFSEESPFIANPDLSSKWTSIYYEMFARSSKKEGLPPILVTNQVKETYLRLFMVHIINNLHDNNINLYETIDADRKNRRARDDSFSPELAKFWRSVAQDVEMEKQEGVKELEIESNLIPLYAIQAVLQKQQDEYALIGEFMTK